MKGVIVQTVEPKSIVLLNNGKIMAIPTPANCHVGMVVTVKYRNLLKILIIAFAAVLLIALGIFIGIQFFGRGAATPASNAAPVYEGHMPMHRGMMEQRRRMMEQGR